MKKNIEYLNIADSWLSSDVKTKTEVKYNLTEKELLNFINMIREDTIRDTVIECSKSATTKDVGFYDGEKWNPYDIVDETSILSVKDKLINELE